MSYVELSFIGSKSSLTSRAIQLFSAGPVSHVDAVEPLTGLLWCARFDKVGVRPRGFWPRPASYIAKETIHVVIRIPCTAVQQRKFWEITRKAQGTPYDWRGILAFGFGQNWHKRGTAFCSEAQRDHLQAAGILPKDFFERGYKTTPMMLLTALTARDDTKIVLRQGC